ncbi:MAG: SpoIIE family protein phosphatase [Flavobacteriales bacterium]|nr:SpoIIE family protein phosphatase [Flavobacteriales bacterium]
MKNFWRHGITKMVGVIFVGMTLAIVALISHGHQLRVDHEYTLRKEKMELVARALKYEIERDHSNGSIPGLIESVRHHLDLPAAISIHFDQSGPVHQIMQEEGQLTYNLELQSGHSANVPTIRINWPITSWLQEESDLVNLQIATSAFTLLFLAFFALRILLNSTHTERVKRNKFQLKSNLIEQKNQDLTASIQYARKLQSALKPDDRQLDSSFENFFNISLPRDIIGGDFFWFHDQPSANVKIAIQADCTGHGVPGAMMSVLGNTLLAEIVVDYDIYDPAMILELMNKKLMLLLKQDGVDTIADGMDISVFSLNTDTGKLTYAGANQSIVIVRNGEMIVIKGDRSPLGGFHFESRRKFTNRFIRTNPGDRIYMYTDGFKDQFGGEKGKRMKRKGFEELLLNTSQLPLAQQHEELLNSFSDWKGAREQVDDVSLVGFELA